MQSSSIFFLGIVAAAVFLPLLWAVGTFNGLIRLRNHVRESFSDIDTELKRRHDLIPNLVATVKAYAAHEEQVLTQVIEARARAGQPHERVRDLGRDESDLARGVNRLFALGESYPELKADRSFLSLQSELVNTEDRIQAARRFYNANVRDLNNRIEMFPGSIIAGMMSVAKADYFEVEHVSVRQAPSVEM